jgi:hypothetical protein
MSLKEGSADMGATRGLGFLCIAIAFAAACTRTNRSTPQKSQPSQADRNAIAAVIDAQTAQARRAWELRDASLIIPDTTQGAVRETAEGATTEAASMRADIQRRMDMTTRVDTMSTVLDSLHAVGADSVRAYSSQRFVRMIRLSETEERQRISTVTHEQLFIRRAGRWEAVGPLREISPRAWWAGESPPH